MPRGTVFLLEFHAARNRNEITLQMSLAWGQSVSFSANANVVYEPFIAVIKSIKNAHQISRKKLDSRIPGLLCVKGDKSAAVIPK